jgi:hypothetical protein
VLLETVRQLRQVRDSLGGGLLPWRPDDALMSALVPVHNARPW